MKKFEYDKDKMIVMLAMGYAYIDEHRKEGLAWRLKEGKTTGKDLKHIEKAMTCLKGWEKFSTKA